MTLRNKQWLLISRAAGEPTPENFKLVETEVPDRQHRCARGERREARRRREAS